MNHSSTARTNPFYQPAKQWQIRVIVPQAFAPLLEDAFADIALTTSSFELNEDSIEWVVDILITEPPESLDIDARLVLFSALHELPTLHSDVQQLEAKNWVLEVEQSFAPMTIGRFYVHGSHTQEPVPHGKIAIEINAGAAFGSGEHATTRGCLLAISELAKRHRFNKPLDMGCGSGILAIAMAKCWRTTVIGSDIDPVSIEVARENAVINTADQYMRYTTGNGYASRLVAQHAPYDLIVANILARPLMRLARHLNAHLATGGYVILSGLLVTQERMVLSAHAMQGLRLYARIRDNGWSALILRK